MPGIAEIVIGAFTSIFDMIILMIYLKSILQHKKEEVKNCVYFVSFMFICGIQYSLGWFTSSWLINMLCSLTGIFLLSFLYDNKMLTRIFAAVSFQVFAMLSELLCYTVMQFLQNKNLKLPDDEGTIYAYGMSQLILFVIVIIISLLIKKKSTAVLARKDYLFLLVPPLVSITLIISIAFQNETINPKFMVCFSVVGIMVINFVVYYLFENIIEATEIREKQTQMEVQLDFQEKKYSQASQSFKNINGLIHDTNKHLIYIRECIMQNQNQEAVLYINKAIAAVDKSYKRFNTGNLVIDALVSNAANIANSNNILFKSDIRIDKEKINIERYDFSIVLGNLLDNAIEACQKVANSDDRYINITIVTTETALIVNIINSMERNISSYHTSTGKENKLMHGYGLQNIAKIADKYGGTFYFGKKESSFEASVILPLRDGSFL